MSPTGTLSAFCSSLPKKYATAEKSIDVSGLHGCHLACSGLAGFGLNPASGAGRAYLGTVNSRRFGFVEALAASSPPALGVMRKVHSMLDCPEQTHTSPTSTSLNTA